MADVRSFRPKNDYKDEQQLTGTLNDSYRNSIDISLQTINSECHCNGSEEKMNDITLCSALFKIYPTENPNGSHAESNKMLPTNAFGQMEFDGCEGKTRAKYIRLSDQTKLCHIEMLLKTSWGLKDWPKILISVIGGVHRFSIKSHASKHLKKEIQKLCMKVADMQSETWFITKGTDYGATKLVAEAMQGNKYKNASVIGITTWERLYGRNELKQPQNKIKIPRYFVKREANYREGQLEKDYYLNKDHTHFFLVDSGKQEHVEKETRFRNNFIRYVTNNQAKEIAERELHMGTEDFFVPAIQLVINGGFRTLAQIKQNLYPEMNTEIKPVIMPVVVIADTGRVADWLTFAFENDVSRLEELKSEIQRVFPTQYVEMFEDICQCVKKRVYITIYHPYQIQSLDETILRTFVKTGRVKKDSFISLEQLKMIMRWGREDVAEEMLRLVISDSRFPQRSLQIVFEKLLLCALFEQEMKFFDMIIGIGFDLCQFEKYMLISLYKCVYFNDHEKQWNVLLTFLKQNKRPEEPKYGFVEPPLRKKFLRENPFQILKGVRKEINKLLCLQIVDYYDQENFSVTDPEKELFLWAILCNKQKVAIAFWKRGDDPIAKALIARKMYSKMATRYKMNHPYFDDRVYKSLLRHARYFENEALNLLEKCSMISTSKTAQLMDVKMPRWKQKNCMDLASLSEFEQFIAHQRCQDITDLTWRGHFALYGRYLNVKIITGVLIPGSGALLKYKDTYRHKNKFCCRSKSCHKNTICSLRGLFDKIYAFYDAPITKFWRNAGMYIIFLTLFGHFILNRLERHARTTEYIIFTFIASFLLDEIRSLFQEPGINVRQKFHAWRADPWHKLNALSLIVFFVAFILHQFGNSNSTYLIYTRFSYALDFLLWTIRLLQVISLHERIGVYVVMLQRMISDVVYFVAIVLVFVLGYGIARTAILYPETYLTLTTISQDLPRKIFLKPFFQVMGEMFMDTNVNSTEKTVFQTKKYNDESETFMIILQFLYIVLTNLLFINLLIALFNNTYSDAQAHSDRIWKWNYYQMVKDYQAGSVFPAPISIFSNIFWLIKYALGKSIVKKTVNKESYRQFIPMTEYFEKDTHLNTMKQFENECLSKYLIERNEFLQKKLRRNQSNHSQIKSDSGIEMFQMSKKMDGGFLLYGSDAEDDDDFD